MLLLPGSRGLKLLLDIIYLLALSMPKRMSAAAGAGCVRAAAGCCCCCWCLLLLGVAAAAAAGCCCCCRCCWVLLLLPLVPAVAAAPAAAMDLHLHGTSFSRPWWRNSNINSDLEDFLYKDSSFSVRWVYEGVIDDPYDEFFIAENKSLQKEALVQDYDAKYWQQRYSLKEDIPSFLSNVAASILITGKYLNVTRECGHNAQVPVSDNSKLTNFGANHHYLDCIKAVYDFASGELLNLIKEKKKEKRASETKEQQWLSLSIYYQVMHVAFVCCRP